MPSSIPRSETKSTFGTSPDSPFDFDKAHATMRSGSPDFVWKQDAISTNSAILRSPTSVFNELHARTEFQKYINKASGKTVGQIVAYIRDEANESGEPATHTAVKWGPVLRKSQTAKLSVPYGQNIYWADLGQFMRGGFAPSPNRIYVDTDVRTDTAVANPEEYPVTVSKDAPSEIMLEGKATLWRWYMQIDGNGQMTERVRDYKPSEYIFGIAVPLEQALKRPVKIRKVC